GAEVGGRRQANGSGRDPVAGGRIPLAPGSIRSRAGARPAPASAAGALLRGDAGGLRAALRRRARGLRLSAAAAVRSGGGSPAARQERDRGGIRGDALLRRVAADRCRGGGGPFRAPGGIESLG